LKENLADVEIVFGIVNADEDSRMASAIRCQNSRHPRGQLRSRADLTPVSGHGTT